MTALNYQGKILLPTMSGVSFGSGAVSRELDVISETLGATKIFLISTSSLTESPERGAVEAAIGSRLVGQSFRSVAHTPEALVRQTKDLVLKSGANAIVSLGGSSVIDLAKGVALCLSEGDDFESMRVTFSPEEGMSAPPLNSPKMLHISIPTTLSGSESSFGLGITNEASKEKNVFVDMKLIPRWIFHDPLMCQSTPLSLWSGTGMKIFSDALEQCLSPKANLYTKTLSLAALELINRNLAVSSDDNAHDAKTACFQAGFMVMSNIQNVGLGMVAALRHQLGAVFRIPHGVASSIVLPHVLKWNEEEIEDRLGDVCDRLFYESEHPLKEAKTHNVIQRVEQLMSQLNLPKQLRDFGININDLDSVAKKAAKDFSMAANPRLVRSFEDPLQVLRASL